MKTVALIPLRAGSKGIPNKNIKKIAGKPLCIWTIEAASQCHTIDRVYVATDSDEIAATINAHHFNNVEVIERSAESSSDAATTEFVMLEFAKNREFDQIILIQATSPLLTSEDIEQGLLKLRTSGADSLLSVVPQRRFIWQVDPDGFATPQNYEVLKRPRRQDFPPYYVENGAFYVTSRPALLRTGCRLSGNRAIYAMSEESYYELDDASDWKIIENLLDARVSSASRTDPRSDLELSDIRSRASKIKLILSDVDGVLTDSGMYYTESGDEIKKFNTRDGKAFELMRNAGIKTGIITSEKTQIVANRTRKLKLDFLAQGALVKMPALEAILKTAEVSAEETAYLGDDIGDIPILKAVGLSAAPSDAIPEARNSAHVRLKTRGGHGCLREFVEMILAAQRDEAGS